MQQKIRLRKKYFKLRKKRYYEIDRRFFLPLLKIINLRFKKRKIKIALYYPSSFELNVLKFLEFSNILKKDIFVADFVKAVLKLNNIVSELEKVCLLDNKLELLSKLKKIPDLTLKSIVYSNSLYLHLK